MKAIISAVVLGGLLNVLRGWLYPVATFALGHGAERYRSVVFWRRLVGVSFGVSLLASVTAAYITCKTSSLLPSVRSSPAPKTGKRSRPLAASATRG